MKKPNSRRALRTDAKLAKNEAWAMACHGYVAGAVVLFLWLIGDSFATKIGFKHIFKLDKWECIIGLCELSWLSSQGPLGKLLGFS